MVNTESISDPTLASSPSSLSGASHLNTGGRIHRVAGKVHQAIDKLEHSLSATRGSAMSTQGRYGDRARQASEGLRERVDAKPLQSVGIALASGVIASKLFLRSSKPVRVVRVRAPAAQWDAPVSMDTQGRRWNDAASLHMRRLAGAGQNTAGKVGAAAGLGVERTRLMASTLAQRASTLPLQMRLATQRMLAASQAYGSMARSGVQAHPVAGAGAAFGAAALATLLWWQRRTPASGAAYLTVDEKGHGVAWQRTPREVGTRARDMVTARPVASAAVVLGLGVLAAALLRRR